MYIHLVAGGLAGSTGTLLTSPLEVVKTRFQSSTSSFKQIIEQQHKAGEANKLSTSTTIGHIKNSCTSNLNNLSNRVKLASRAAHSCSLNSTIFFKNNHLSQHSSNLMTSGFNFDTSQQNFKCLNTSSKVLHRPGLGIYLHLKFIIQNEGVKALYKGLGPTLIGVAPYRAIYFYTYANSKQFFARFMGEDRSIMHICSAFVAGFSAVSVTNPIWFIKTRLQLDESRRGVTISQVVNKILKEKGVLGFYKGISASYFGVMETALYFVIYEKLKAISNKHLSDSESNMRFVGYFTSAGFSKSLASCLCYPHEVARTRLRQEGNKYVGFIQTLSLVFKEEGARGLYKGMATHLVRQIPNTMIVMTTYELIVNYFKFTEKTVCLDD